MLHLTAPWRVQIEAGSAVAGCLVAIVADLQDRFDVPIALIGFGIPDDGVHAPNEKYHLPNFYRGIETLIHYILILSQMQRR